MNRQQTEQFSIITENSLELHFTNSQESQNSEISNADKLIKQMNNDDYYQLNMDMYE